MALNKMTLEIQKFGGGTDEFGNMSFGISQSGVMEVYKQINALIVGPEGSGTAVINNRTAVEAALTKGWIGEDRDVFLANLGVLANQISDKLVEYDAAIKVQFESIVDDWDAFQKSNVTAK